MLASSRRAISAVLLVTSALVGCDRLQVGADRALAKLQLKDPCPAPVEGRAPGASTAEAAVACFQQAVSEKSAELLSRVMCRTRQPASCKQTEASQKELAATLRAIEGLDWSTSLGSFVDGADVVGFALDTYPGKPRVSVLYVCRIAEGERWAVCDTTELPRAVAEKKIAT